MKEIIRKTILFSLPVILVVVCIVPFYNVESKIKGYHSGDAVYYNGNLVIATTNSGDLELFKMDPIDRNIVKFVNFTSYNHRFGTPENFMDVMLRAENDSLFVYAVNGRSIFKYNISDLQQARIVNESHDGGSDWLGGLQMINERVATTGSRGVKIWNNNLEVIDSYSIINPGDKIYNTTPAFSDSYIFTLYKGKIKVFDQNSRTFVREIPIDLKWGSDWYKREIYNDSTDNTTYIVDDEAVRKISESGNVVDTFQHTGKLGYDVVPSLNSDYIYFSDGIGVVKLRKSNLDVVTYQYTINLGKGNGWAMGMKVVNDGSGEKVVLFNNSNIIVLNSDLKPLRAKDKVVAVQATKEDTYPDINEPLKLSIDKNRAAGGSMISLVGQGFGANEPLLVEFVNDKLEIMADDSGRFTKILSVPQVSRRNVDIKVSGKLTSFTYNLGFQIE